MSMISLRQHKIGLFLCYFGPLPDYSRLVFRTIAANPTIDWILITDQLPEYQLPVNVRVINYSLSELAIHFSKRLEFNIQFRKPYELCNLRPAFGYVFADLLEGYDFWGHCDLDMVYGDLRFFLPEQILNNYDRIYCRGHLSVYRNAHSVNSAFKLDVPGLPSYRDVFVNPELLPQFDEWPGIWKIFRYHRIPQYHAEVIADISPPNRNYITRFEAEQLANHPHQIFYWHSGKTFQAYYHSEGGLFDHEVAYVHFQKRSFSPPSNEILSAPGFIIGPSGFTPYDRENLSPLEMDNLNSDIPRPWAERLMLFIGRYRRALAKRGINIPF